MAGSKRKPIREDTHLHTAETFHVLLLYPPCPGYSALSD